MFSGSVGFIILTLLNQKTSPRVFVSKPDQNRSGCDSTFNEQYVHMLTCKSFSMALPFAKAHRLSLLHTSLDLCKLDCLIKKPCKHYKVAKRPFGRPQDWAKNPKNVLNFQLNNEKTCLRWLKQNITKHIHMIFFLDNDGSPLRSPNTAFAANLLGPTQDRAHLGSSLFCLKAAKGETERRKPRRPEEGPFEGLGWQYSSKKTSSQQVFWAGERRKKPI